MDCLTQFPDFIWKKYKNPLRTASPREKNRISRRGAETQGKVSSVFIFILYCAHPGMGVTGIFLAGHSECRLLNSEYLNS